MVTPGPKPQAQGVDAERWSHAEYQAIFANALEAIVCIDSQGVVTRANRAVEAIFGYTPAELVGTDVGRLMPSPHRDKHNRYIERYLDTGEQRIIGIGREVTGLRKDGSEVPLELSILDIRLNGARSFVGIMRDISGRKQAENLLRQRERELLETREQLLHLERLRVANTLSTGIAHELTQPLTAIGLFARSCRQLLDSGDVDIETLSSTLARIERLTAKAGDVIENLRNLTRPQQAAERRRANLNQLIEATVELAMIDKRGQDIAVELDLAPDLPAVEMARTQVQLVLLNLVRNACEALAGTPHGARRILVRSRRLDEGFVAVTVRDSGPGIARDLMARIFEPFYTVKASGIGMGLPISRSIIELHGGTLQANAENTEGAEFTFTLPVSRPGHDP